MEHIKEMLKDTNEFHCKKDKGKLCIYEKGCWGAYWTK